MAISKTCRGFTPPCIWFVFKEKKKLFKEDLEMVLLVMGTVLLYCEIIPKQVFFSLILREVEGNVVLT